MLMIERLLHSAALAICEAVGDLLNIIVSIISSFERRSFGAMLRRGIWILIRRVLAGSGGRPLRGVDDGLYLLTLAHPSAQ
jgi:hypothetical protein